MTKKLYYHKTDGGAEYLMDTFNAWTHNGKSGKEGTVTDQTKILIRIDGDITKDVEVITDNTADLMDALQQAQAFIVANRNNFAVKPSRIIQTIQAAIRKATEE